MAVSRLLSCMKYALESTFHLGWHFQNGIGEPSYDHNMIMGSVPWPCYGHGTGPLWSCNWSHYHNMIMGLVAWPFYGPVTESNPQTHIVIIGPWFVFPNVVLSGVSTPVRISCNWTNEKLPCVQGPAGAPGTLASEPLTSRRTCFLVSGYIIKGMPFIKSRARYDFRLHFH